jgi:hypothetical protein
VRDLLLRLLRRSYQTLLRHKRHLCSFGVGFFGTEFLKQGRPGNSNFLLAAYVTPERLWYNRPDFLP